MLYFVYCADRPGTLALRDELVEAHWAYMDGFGGMVARGPTLTADRSEPTGSLHIVDLASDEDARAFAEEEPNWRAGVYASVTMYRYEDLLGRTMWEFPGVDGDRFLVTALSPETGPAAARVPGDTGAVIAFGRLFALGDGRPAGVAACVQAADPEAAAAVVAAPGATVTVQAWQFGGRR